MSQPDILAQLAAEMVPCPYCSVSGTKEFLQFERGEHGDDCGGTGTVPLIPGLRFYANWVQDITGSTNPVGGYTLVGEAEALLVLLEWTCEHWQDHYGTQADVDFTYYEKAGKRVWVATICCGHANFPDDIEGEGESPGAALASAIAGP